jgi:hypothetical protein
MLQERSYLGDCTSLPRGFTAAGYIGAGLD